MFETTTSQKLLELLAQRHKKDVFVAECKDGPTWNGPHLRLDAWAMNRSWAQACCYGYEIKVSRSDFLRDRKWTGYLPYCNAFFFVTPGKIVDKSELPPEVGLLEATSRGGRLIMRKPAQRRTVEIPDCLWRYILMCRAHIVRECGLHEPATREYWQDWLRQKQDDRSLGNLVGKTIRETIANRIENLEKKNEELLDAHKQYENIMRTLKRLGFSDGWIPSTWNVESKIKDMLTSIPQKDLLIAIRGLRSHLDSCESALNRLALDDGDEG